MSRPGGVLVHKSKWNVVEQVQDPKSCNLINNGTFTLEPYALRVEER